MSAGLTALLILAVTSPTWISLAVRFRVWRRQGMTAAERQERRLCDLYGEGSA